MKFDKINICSKLNISQLNDFISKYKNTSEYSEDTFLIMNSNTMRAIQCEINNMSQKKSIPLVYIKRTDKITAKRSLCSGIV